MAGIVAYGAYIPIYRLNRESIWLTWGGMPVSGEKAVANFDEDSVTMAVEAGNNDWAACYDNVSAVCEPGVDNSPNTWSEIKSLYGH